MCRKPAYAGRFPSGCRGVRSMEIQAFPRCSLLAQTLAFYFSILRIVGINDTSLFSPGTGKISSLMAERDRVLMNGEEDA